MTEIFWQVHGQTSDEDAKEFEEATTDFGKIDEGMWGDDSAEFGGSCLSW